MIYYITLDNEVVRECKTEEEAYREWDELTNTFAPYRVQIIKKCED